MTTLFYDLETLPTSDPDTVKRLLSNMKAPGQFKKPESIQKWLNDPENKEEVIKKTALSGDYGQILCVGYAIDDGDVDILVGDEESIIVKFAAILRGERGLSVRYKLVGHNIIKFDNHFLSKRMMKFGLGPLAEYGLAPYKLDYYDTMVAWAGHQGHISQDDLCFILNIDSSKNKMNGFEIYQYYVEGRLNEIYEYCKSDVEAVRQIYLKLNPRS